MTDYQGALEKAVYDRLVAQITLATVYQHVPENQPPPVVILGDVDFEDEGDKEGPLLRYSVTIVSVIAGPGRKPLNALQAQVHAALDRWRPSDTETVLFSEMTVASGTGQEIQGESGPVYFGQQIADIYLQPAD